MNVYEIYRNVISTGEYRITDMEERIETVYAQGKITAEERASLIALANDSARDELQIDIVAKLADLESRIAV